jgi:soluble lytic murein transglycosylase-like protein
MCVCTSALPARAQKANARGESGSVMMSTRAAGGAPSTYVLQAGQFPTNAGKEERYRFLLPYILFAARKNGVDPYLLTTVCDIETAFQPGATSPVGAQGLTQLMPATAARFGVSNAYDFVQALDGGAKYLRFLTELFGGNLDLILAGYNSGEGNVLKYGRRVPPFSETQGYVTRGRSAYLRYLQSQVGDLALLARTGGLRLTAAVAGRAPSPAPAEELEVEPQPVTRSLVFGEEPEKPSAGDKEKNQPSPGPSRATRSIRFQ